METIVADDSDDFVYPRNGYLSIRTQFLGRINAYTFVGCLLLLGETPIQLYSTNDDAGLINCHRRDFVYPRNR